MNSQSTSELELWHSTIAFFDMCDNTKPSNRKKFRALKPCEGSKLLNLGLIEPKSNLVTSRPEVPKPPEKISTP